MCSFLDLRSTIFRFCVKFYPPDPALLQEEYTRYCNFIIWLALRVCKMNQILQCDWLPGLVTWCCLVAVDCMLCPARKIPWSHSYMYNKSFIDLGSLFGQDGWILAWLFFVCIWTVTLSRPGQYPVNMTSCLVNNAGIYPWCIVFQACISLPPWFVYFLCHSE